MKTQRTLDETLVETVEQLHRRVAWQVAAAYGLPLPEPEAQAPQPVAELASPSPEPATEQRVSDTAPVSDTPAVVEPLPVRVLKLPTLDELERAVAAAEAAEREQTEQWQWTLFYLREYSEPDGRLPECFEPLVATEFAPLLYNEPK